MHNVYMVSRKSFHNKRMVITFDRKSNHPNNLDIVKFGAQQVYTTKSYLIQVSHQDKRYFWLVLSFELGANQ